MRDFEAFEKGLQGGVPVPVHVFVGNELFLARRATDLVRRQLGSDCIVSHFDCLRPQSDGRDVGAGVFSSLYNATFLGNRRLTVVENGYAFLRDQAERLAEFGAKPARGAFLCVVVAGEARRLSVVSKPPKGFEIVACDAPARAAELWPWLERWTKRLADERGKKFSDKAMQILLARASGDLGDIGAQIQKLAAYVGPREIISSTDVEKLVSDESEHTAFQLGAAALAGKKGAALELMRSLVASGATPEHVLGGLVWQLHALRKSYDAQRRPGSANRGTAQDSGGYGVDRYARQAAGLSPAKLRKAFAAAYEADRDIKTGAMEPDAALELLAVNLTRALAAGVLGK